MLKLKISLVDKEVDKEKDNTGRSIEQYTLLENTSDNHNKFYEIYIEKLTTSTILRVRYGVIGNSGKKNFHSFFRKDIAQITYYGIIQRKLKNGYKIVIKSI